MAYADLRHPLRLAIVSGHEREQKQSACAGQRGGASGAPARRYCYRGRGGRGGKYRQGCLRAFEWRVKRKADLEEELRERERQGEREARERQAKREQARVDRLLDEPASLRRAADIRAYVIAVKQAVEPRACCRPPMCSRAGKIGPSRRPIASTL